MEGIGLWIAATAAAYLVKGLCGFANTLVFTAVLSFGSDNIYISPVDLLMGLPSNLSMAWQYRKKIDLRLCLPVIVLTLLGDIPGIFFLKNVDARWIKLFFGVVVVLLGAEMLWREYRPAEKKASKALMAGIALLSGLLCGLYGVGALLAAYFSRVTDDPEAFKGDISFAFGVEHLWRVILYLCMHILTWKSVQITLILLVPLMAFMYLGMWVGKKLPTRTVKKIIIVLLILSGISLIAYAL